MVDSGGEMGGYVAEELSVWGLEEEAVVVAASQSEEWSRRWA